VSAGGRGGSESVVVVGAGQAGVGVAAALRRLGYRGRIVVVGQEVHLPYRRPGLSKSFLVAPSVDQRRLALRSAKWYAEHRIELVIGQSAREIDRDRRVVRLDGGGRLRYDNLVLAAGTRARTLPVAGTDLDGVCALRALDDARRLRARLDAARDVVVVGAGFIGMEVAAAAHRRGLRPTVIDMADRVMQRAVSSTISDYFGDTHRGWGTTILTGCTVVQMRGVAERFAR
jgi:3-phenylpropionate/trans-cinnamate dioxygenase ferredoxin reductase component